MNTHGHTVEEWRKICRANEKKHRLRHPEKVRAKEKRGRIKNSLKVKARAASYRAANREKVLASKKKWQQDNWSHRQEYLRAYYASNREQIKKRSNEGYHSNKTARIASQKIYLSKLTPEEQLRRKDLARKARRLYVSTHKAEYAAHAAKRRALKLKASVNPNKISEWMVAMRKRKDVVCYYCEAPIRDSGINFDHVIPLSKGGPHEIGNLAASCEFCNSSKNDSFLGQWNVKAQQPVLPL